ncbi:ATP-dependent RNA helicase [Mycoemilia scoparia]|uniref:ATP-dependent RNA helicase n=1 Tax=Mycoemilia scoparia TaxID=417184 RepID=A0A9W7ZZZ7_9FUNG|nr:ATP-dependent RNA helicase [Mycoemilia scoparia]
MNKNPTQTATDGYAESVAGYSEFDDLRSEAMSTQLSYTSGYIDDGAEIASNAPRPRRERGGSDEDEEDLDFNKLTLRDQAGNKGVGDNSILSDSDNGIDSISDDEILEEDLPEHACKYCGIHNPESVAKCLTCKKWFCNWRGNTAGSHIVSHLMFSRHKEVQLHEDGPLGETVLECFNCGNKNIFLLGYIPAKGDAVIVILCRSPCAAAPSSKDVTWDASQWQPLISERSFLPWLLQIPMRKEQQRARPINKHQMFQLEDAWRTNANATLVDIEKPTVEDELQPVLLRYKDAKLYRDTFSPLIAVEAEYEKMARESLTQENVDVRWDVGLSNQHLAWFTLKKYELGEARLAIGDELKLRYSGELHKEWESRGTVMKLPDNFNDEICLHIFKPDAPTNLTSNFCIDYVWNGTMFKRMQKAIDTFTNMSSKAFDREIRAVLLGQKSIEPKSVLKPHHRFSIPNLPDLNRSQVMAIKYALSQPITLIQGPPGTGKTVTSATLVYHLAKLEHGKILVCAPSNVAVDQLAEKIHQTGLRVVRMTARNRESIDSNIDFLTLHEQVRISDSFPELKKYTKLKQEQGELSRTDESRFFTLRYKAEQEILKHADVVLCTCAGAGDPRLSRLKFRSVLIDESTQSSEPECLIPLVTGVKRIVFVGDHQQLGPVISNNKVAQAGLIMSLFERLILLGLRPHRLEVQYRMHPCLSEFPSNYFYEGSLQNGVSAPERLRPEVDFPWPSPQNPMMMYSCLGSEEVAANGSSFLNRVEAANCEKVVSRLLKAGIKPEQIGIITPYEGQRSWMVQQLSSAGCMSADVCTRIEILSVDAFQGREKDYIILSCVRSNDRQGIGFLNNPRRLNVALTRAKYGLVILGNPKVLSRNQLWRELITHFKQRGCLVEGPLENLRPCLINLGRLPKPKPLSEAHLKLLQLKNLETNYMARLEINTRSNKSKSTHYIPPDFGGLAQADSRDRRLEVVEGSTLPSADRLNQVMQWLSHGSMQNYMPSASTAANSHYTESRHDGSQFNFDGVESFSTKDIGRGGDIDPDTNTNKFHSSLHSYIGLSQSDRIQLINGSSSGENALDNTSGFKSLRSNNDLVGSSIWRTDQGNFNLYKTQPADSIYEYESQISGEDNLTDINGNTHTSSQNPPAAAAASEVTRF